MFDTINNIAKIFLYSTNDIIIIPLIILGYIWIDQKLFSNTICLVLISMLVNFALKVTFKIPLSPLLERQGFAFPSGHMQMAVVLYGWLITKIKNIIYQILIIDLLIGTASSLVYFGYHNYFDILGAVFFGALLIIIYSYLLKHIKHYLPFISIIFSTLLMIYIAAQYEIAEHVWMAYYALIGFLGAEKIFRKNLVILNIPNKIIATVFCFSIFFIIKKIFIQISLPTFVIQLQWLIMGFAIPSSVYIFNKTKTHN